MTVPGFTAETSLSRVEWGYQMAIATNASPAQLVRPAGFLAYAACTAACTLFSFGIGFPECSLACLPMFAVPEP
jgi:hypothetical protein